MSELTPYALITMSITGNIRAERLAPSKSYTTQIYQLESVLPELVEGGSIIDMWPLEGNSNLATWVHKSPLFSGELDGEIRKLSAEVRDTARMMSPHMGGEFQQMSFFMSLPPELNADEEEEAGGFDYVPASYLVRYWQKRGARIGKRVGNTIEWSDGEKQESIKIV